MAADWARTPFGEPDERYRWNVSVAWRWLVGGVLAIAVGLAVWPTTFILVLGHRSAAFTLTVYGHIFDAGLDLVAENLDQAGTVGGAALEPQRGPKNLGGGLFAPGRTSRHSTEKTSSSAGWD